MPFSPRVGRRRDQPWAGGQNPVGVCAERPQRLQNVGLNKRNTHTTPTGFRPPFLRRFSNQRNQTIEKCRHGELQKQRRLLCRVSRGFRHSPSIRALHVASPRRLAPGELHHVPPIEQTVDLEALDPTRFASPLAPANSARKPPPMLSQIGHSHAFPPNPNRTK